MRGSYYIVGVLVLVVVVGGIWTVTRGGDAPSLTPDVLAAEIIPSEGDPTDYGMPMSLDNTQQFIDYYEATALTPAQDSIMWDALLPLKAPCCDDNSMATCCCPCNLAKSVWGLSSYLIVEKNYGVEEVRESAHEWLRFIHDDYYVIQGLKESGVNPAKFGMVHENPCYAGACELPFRDGGCGGMGLLKQ
jgi:hypothetical protein